MENSKELEIDIEDIGTILKSSRLKSKKSMEEISSELCIRKIYLTALEEGDYDILPPVPYGVGYVRTYARFLGLNEERAVKLYKAASISNSQKEEEPEEVPEANKSSNWHIIAGIIALAAVYGGWSWYGANMAKKTAEPIRQNQGISINLPQNEPETQTSVIPNEKEPLEIEEETAAIEENGENISQEQQAGETPAEEAVVAVEPIVDNKVVIEFVGESWVELKDKNKVYFQGVFHDGDKKEIEYVDNLFLSVGRPYNVKVTIKGKEKDILAKKRKMNIPLDSLD